MANFYSWAPRHIVRGTRIGGFLGLCPLPLGPLATPSAQRAAKSPAPVPAHETGAAHWGSRGARVRCHDAEPPASTAHTSPSPLPSPSSPSPCLCIHSAWATSDVTSHLSTDLTILPPRHVLRFQPHPTPPLAAFWPGASQKLQTWTCRCTLLNVRCGGLCGGHRALLVGEREKGQGQAMWRKGQEQREA